MMHDPDDHGYTKPADACLENLLNRIENETIRTKLTRMHAVCLAIVSGEDRLTISGVARNYKKKHKGFGPKLAESSIRNKRDGANPYIELYAAWETVAVIINELKDKVRERDSRGEILSVKETFAIEDLSLRHRVAQTITRARGLSKELNLLRAKLGKEASITIAPLPSKTGGAPSSRPSLDLSHIEAEAIRTFLESLDNGMLRRTRDDAVKLPSGEYITQSGFVAALTKVLEAVEPIPF